jgi:hypothetical protein
MAPLDQYFVNLYCRAVAGRVAPAAYCQLFAYTGRAAASAGTVATAVVAAARRSSSCYTFRRHISVVFASVSRFAFIGAPSTAPASAGAAVAALTAATSIATVATSHADFVHTLAQIDATLTLPCSIENKRTRRDIRRYLETEIAVPIVTVHDNLPYLKDWPASVA